MSEAQDYPYLSFVQREVLPRLTDPFLLPTSRLFLAYLASSFLIAIIAHAITTRKRGIDSSPVADIVPRSVYLHRSAIVDYGYFVVNAIVSAFLLAPFAGVSIAVSGQLSLVLRDLGLATNSAVATPWVVNVLGTLGLVAAADFSSFLVHLWFHRVPLLWEFHKVHHSAEVMTPVTVLRMHPVDDLVTMLVGGLLIGAVDALLRVCVDPGFSPIALYGLTIFTFLFYLFGYNLRHSHVWVSYSPWLSRLLISPAQHQIHHSKAKRHWDKNFGFMFAVWDWMFGFLYVPKEPETLEFGLGTSEDGEYSSVLRLYLLPFVKLFRRYQRGRRSAK
jgi:sterol desaturase/sphingolipid hydroxylase (fatty acid hydroxylase superfamily)